MFFANCHTVLKFLSGIKILGIFQLIYPKKKKHNREQNEAGNVGVGQAVARVGQRRGEDEVKLSSPRAEAWALESWDRWRGVQGGVTSLGRRRKL